MKHSAPKRMTIGQLENLARSDRRRMIVMGIGVLILGGGVIGTSMLQNKYENQTQTQHTEAILSARVVIVSANTLVDRAS